MNCIGPNCRAFCLPLVSSCRADGGNFTLSPWEHAGLMVNAPTLYVMLDSRTTNGGCLCILCYALNSALKIKQILTLEEKKRRRRRRRRRRKHAGWPTLFVAQNKLQQFKQTISVQKSLCQETTNRRLGPKWVCTYDGNLRGEWVVRVENIKTIAPLSVRTTGMPLFEPIPPVRANSAAFIRSSWNEYDRFLCNNTRDWTADSVHTYQKK